MKHEVVQSDEQSSVIVVHGLPAAPLAMPRQVLEGRPFVQRLRRRIQRWLADLSPQRAGAGR